jgi:V8-like Glu-specific endopeptidase
MPTTGTEAARPKITKPGGEHTSVSNQPEEGEVTIKKAVSEPASFGSEAKPNKAADDGTEPVKGYGARTESASARVFAVPEIADLRDIGEASFGTPPPIAETVHGPDDRVQITTTTAYPWRAIASLLITAADNSTWIGTGWFIGPKTLITAGHCVYIKNSGVPGRDGWVKRIQVMPGRNGNTLPYGSVTSTTLRSVTGWTNSGSETFDYGAIILPTLLGNTVGWFGFGVYPDADLVDTTGNVSGYPGDKPGGTHWFDARRIASVNSRKVYYDIDTAGGQSGAPVFRIVNGNRMAFGIHAYGGAVTNSGTRIITDVYNNMVAWKA